MCYILYEEMTSDLTLWKRLTRSSSWPASAPAPRECPCAPFSPHPGHSAVCRCPESRF